ncbi:MAG TPA: hypothetical protein VF618_00655 [Thermoanaerobaculia bacterium]
MRRAFLLTLILLAACSGESPTEPNPGLTRGRLQGLVTVGGLPPAPGSRKVEVYDEPRRQLLFAVDIDAGGVYLIDLPGGRYTVDVRGVAGDRSEDVPRVVEIVPLGMTRHDIRITRN